MDTENQTAPSVARKHKLEIQIFEADYTDVPDGSPPKWRPVDVGLDRGKPIIVEVADKKEFAELQKQYALCDQKIKVIREIDPFDDHLVAQQIPQNNQAVPVNAQIPQQAAQNNAVQANSQPQAQSISASSCAPAQKPKPKIITVGDMQIKYDGDKVYQRQWVKLNAHESANFRVVNDANNKIINLNGKHIECKKWVIVEDEEEKEDSYDDAVESYATQDE